MIATSTRAEGNAVAKSYGGGGIDIGAPFAEVKTRATVRSHIDDGATVLAGGNVNVEAAAKSDATGIPLNDFFQPAGVFPVNPTPDVNTTEDTIEFLSHGLNTGEEVTYDKASGTFWVNDAGIVRLYAREGSKAPGAGNEPPPGRVATMARTSTDGRSPARNKPAKAPLLLTRSAVDPPPDPTGAAELGLGATDDEGLLR